MKAKIGVDIGGTKIVAGLVVGNKILDRCQIRSGQGMLERIKKAIKKLFTGNKITKIGIGCAGLVDPRRGLVHFSPNIEEFKNLMLAEKIRNEFKINTTVINDVNAFCCGEWIHGAGKGFKNFICLTLGTGIGGAAVIDGRMLWGEHSMAGEFGHMVIDKDGPDCFCGKEGCFERLAAKDAIIDLGRRRGLKNLSPKEIANLAKRGNKKAIDVYNRIGSRLAIGIGNLINIFDPEAVIIGGGIAKSGMVLFGPLRKYIGRQVMGYKFRNIKIVKAKLGTSATVLGAAHFEKKFLATS